MRKRIGGRSKQTARIRPSITTWESDFEAAFGSVHLAPGIAVAGARDETGSHVKVDDLDGHRCGIQERHGRSTRGPSARLARVDHQGLALPYVDLVGMPIHNDVIEAARSERSDLIGFVKHQELVVGVFEPIRGPMDLAEISVLVT